MSTNIITINCIHDVITNTVTNHITNCPSNLNPINPTVFSNLSHLVVKVAEMPSKAWWLDFTFWGAMATIVSAAIMACSVQKMGEQIKISQQSVEEMKRQRELQQRQWEEDRNLKELTIIREHIELNIQKLFDGIYEESDTALFAQLNLATGFECSSEYIEKVFQDLEKIIPKQWELYYSLSSSSIYRKYVEELYTKTKNFKDVILDSKKSQYRDTLKINNHLKDYPKLIECLYDIANYQPKDT